MLMYDSLKKAQIWYKFNQLEQCNDGINGITHNLKIRGKKIKKLQMTKTQSKKKEKKTISSSDYP